ncbi:MAG TPA: DivIVA domain-containing protein [Thermoanaerobaculia bacterium]|jgi:cell division initiation protein|nr:DivIVA domain-containing protein [Thermoanaerobaculia bacterium]
MSLTPLAIGKMKFGHTLRGYNTSEVEDFLSLVSEELAKSLGEMEKLREERDRLERRMRQGEDRERELQDTLLRAQKVSDEILANAQREAQLLVKEAELTADRLVQQAIEQASGVERGIGELRHRRRELQLKLKNTIELYARILEADMLEDQERRATIHAMPRERQG